MGGSVEQLDRRRAGPQVKSLSVNSKRPNAAAFGTSPILSAQPVTHVLLSFPRNGPIYSYPVGTSEYEEVWPERTYQVVTTEPNRRMSLWAIGLTEKLPTIPVPLSYPDPPAILNLQRSFTELYTYSTYRQRTVEELTRLRPPLRGAEEEQLGVFSSNQVSARSAAEIAQRPGERQSGRLHRCDGRGGDDRPWLGSW